MTFSFLSLRESREKNEKFPFPREGKKHDYFLSLPGKGKSIPLKGDNNTFSLTVKGESKAGLSTARPYLPSPVL